MAAPTWGTPADRPVNVSIDQLAWPRATPVCRHPWARHLVVQPNFPGNPTPTPSVTHTHRYTCPARRVRGPAPQGGCTFNLVARPGDQGMLEIYNDNLPSMTRAMWRFRAPGQHRRPLHRQQLHQRAQLSPTEGYYTPSLAGRADGQLGRDHRPTTTPTVSAATGSGRALPEARGSIRSCPAGQPVRCWPMAT